jgi:hypothetical protein
MRLKATVLAIMLSIFVGSMALQAQRILPQAVITAMKSGNAAGLSPNLNNSVEISVLGNESVCSKAQTEQILKDFFAKHTVKSFSVLFEGGKENSLYAIGKLVTANGSFRVTYLIKGQIIHQIRIEQE